MFTKHFKHVVLLNLYKNYLVFDDVTADVCLDASVELRVEGFSSCAGADVASSECVAFDELLRIFVNEVERSFVEDVVKGARVAKENKYIHISHLYQYIYHLSTYFFSQSYPFIDVSAI